jgi:hypothetical protein
MSAPLPIVARYEGEGLFHALGRSKRESDAEYVVGEVYRLTRYEERSEASHRHFFASLHEAWANLPADLSERFPTSERLRKFALIKSGFATQRQLVASSRAEALRLAAFVAPMDEYALVETRGAVVTVWEAESQSMRAMGKKRFAESKDAVLGFCASLIGVEPETLREEAGKAA